MSDQPFWYTLTDGVTISEYPSDRYGDDPYRLEAALEHGHTAFIDLTEPEEVLGGTRQPLPPYDQLLSQLAAQRGLTVVYHRFAVRDLSAPTAAVMWSILDAIDSARAAGHHVLIHCLGGIGRSGTVAGCYLVRHGWTAEQALAHIQEQIDASRKAGRRSPETSAQIELVKRWHAEEATRKGSATSLYRP